MKPLFIRWIALGAWILPAAIHAQLPAPTLTTPAHNSVGYMRCATFKWNAVTGADKYEIQIAANSNFSTIVDTDLVELTRYVPRDALYPSNRFWRVRALDGSGGAGAWSGTFIYQLREPVTQHTVSPADSWSTIQNLINTSAGPVKIIFTFGTYTFTPAHEYDQYALKLNGRQDVVLEGNTSTIKLVAAERNGRQIIPGFAGITAAVQSDGSLVPSKRIHIRRFVIEHDPVPHVVGTVQSLVNNGASQAQFTLRKDGGYPDYNAPVMTGNWSFGCILDPNVTPAGRGRLKPDANTVYYFDQNSIVKLANGDFRITATHPGYATIAGQVSAGDRVIMFARSGNTFPVAFNWKSEDLAYEEITAYTTPQVHFVSHECSDFKALKCRGLKKGSRWFAGNGDGVHVFANRTGPWIEGCTFDGIGDDGIALYNKGVVAMQQPQQLPNNTSRVRVYPEIMDFQPGDQFKISRALPGTMDATVYTVSACTENKTSGTVTSVDVDFSPQLTSSLSLTGSAAGNTLHHNDQFFSLSERCGNFVIRNNTLKNIRRFGCIVRSTVGVISENTFEGVSTSPIVLLNEANAWRTGPYSYNILIRDNLLTDNAFDIDARNFGHIHVGFVRPDPNDPWGHLASASTPNGLITIRHNTITDWEHIGIFLANAASSVVSQNIINARRTPPLIYDPLLDAKGIVLAHTHGCSVLANDLSNATVPALHAIEVPASTNANFTISGNILPP